MLKCWDYECMSCGAINEHYLQKEECGHVKDFQCPVCEEVTSWKRLPALTAKYLGEKMRNDFNPSVHGGRFDTMGGGEVTKLPDSGSASTLDDYRDHFATKEFKEAKAQRKEDVARNRAKQARAKLVKEGKASMREMPLAGDPKELHK